MSKIKIIKNQEDYQEALKMTEELMACDPNPDSAEGEQLNLLVTLIKDYEKSAFEKSLPTPIEAIKFRMEQGDLKPVDLIPFIGSRSRVSEILSGKRQLTIDMIRTLSNGLGIPAEVLIQKPNIDYEAWDNRLVLEMEKRGYFGDVSIKENTKSELLKSFFGKQSQFVAMHRKSHYRTSPLTEKHALSAWTVRVIRKAEQIKVSKKYKQGLVDLNFMQDLAKLSIKENGPLLAQEHLKNSGIILIIESHLPKTYLDGGVILTNKNKPIIGSTLRYDRLDNFWFTLMHELAHIALHFDQDIFYDEIENTKEVNIDTREQEADALAGEALLPSAKWEVSPARLIPSPMAVNSLANELGVHKAVIAGQIRHRTKKYNYLSKIVNNEKVRKYFLKDKNKKHA